ncbi:hypothetical protein OSTOST_21835, partial [Ostertagia ostertagi]
MDPNGKQHFDFRSRRLPDVMISIDDVIGIQFARAQRIWILGLSNTKKYVVASDANYAAQFYLECVCHADETERILNRTSSRDKKRRKPKPFRDTLSTISLLPLYPYQV